MTDGTVQPWQLLLGVVVQNVILFALVVGLFWAGVAVARGFGRRVSYSLRPLGFSRPKGGYLAGAGLGFLVGMGALVASLVVAPISAYVVEWLGYSTERTVQGPLMEGLSGWVGERPAVAIPAIISVVVLFGPAVEELVFRGAIFGGLYRLGLLVSRKLGGGKPGEGREKGSGGVSFALAALVSSAGFALLHFEPVILPVLFMLALALCVLYRRTRSLLPCVAAHATFNSFATLLVILSGLGALPMPV